nr:MAG TPA: hypothetical protein [Caudoviricetes sp.]
MIKSPLDRHLLWVQLHRPSLSAMTLNYISFYFYLSLVIITGLLYYMGEVKIRC